MTRGRRTGTRRPGIRHAGGVLLAAFLALGGVLATATAASAHDVLEKTTPAQGSSVATAPAAVTLTYNNPVFNLGGRVQVVGPAGDITAGQPEFQDQVVTQPIRPDAPAGTYTVRWQVTSSDGHPIAGTWSFTVQQGAASSTTDAAAPTAEATTPAAQPTATAAGDTAAGDTASGDDSGSSTGLIIGVTAVAAVVLLGAAGVVLVTGRRRGD